jgi:hypothetical protein
MPQRSTVLIVLTLLISIPLVAQELPTVYLSGLRDQQSLAEVLGGLEKTHHLQFFFRDAWLEPFRVQAAFNGMSLQAMLEELFRGTEYSFTLLGDRQVIILKDQQGAQARTRMLQTAREEKKTIVPVSLGSYAEYVPGKPVTLSGRVIDQKNRLSMGGVSIQVTPIHESTTTSPTGRYTLTLPAGEYVLSYGYLNYEEKLVDLKIYRDGSLDMELQEMPFYLDEVIISGERMAERVGGQVRLQLQALKRAPTFLGEADIIKQLQVQPGVSTVGEAATGFNVRGGGADQNLVLFDGIPIFNLSHVLGFFTAFNPDALSDVAFYRGNTPAEFGGRVASTLNITAREGNRERWSGKGGIGLITSSVTLDGPIKKDTSSLLLSFRTSYSDWVLRAVESTFQNVRNSSAFFYDGMVKVSHRTHSGNKITFSAYRSHDQFRLANDTTLAWQNQTAVLRYDHAHGGKLFGSYAIGVGHYGYQVHDEDPSKAFTLKYGITYPTLRADYVLDAGKNPLAFGLNSSWYTFRPGRLTPGSENSNIRNVAMPAEQSLETAVYLQRSYTLRPNLILDAGLRYALYFRFGPGMVYQYDPAEPREPRNTTDSTFINRGKVIQAYHGPEPRVALRYAWRENQSFKLSYNRFQQFLHLVSNTAAITPVDIWQPSNTYFKPQLADMLALGYYTELKDRTFEAFGEVYYRITNNILDFKDGADLILNRQLETALLLGKSTAYGFEASVTKQKGRLTGNMNYTFARSLRRVDGAFESERINDGQTYPANYDQPHMVNVSWRYGISRRHHFTGGFTYRTGRPMSLPVSGYEVDGVLISQFSDRNQYRIPDYHRLDLAFVIEGNHKIKKPWSGTWVVSCYNVYARKNPFSVFFNDDGTGYLQPYRLAIIGTAIPTVTYTFKF